MEVLDGVADEPHCVFNRIDPRAPADHLLEDVILRRGADTREIKSSFLCHCLVHGQHHRCNCIDGESRAYAIQLNVRESVLKVP